MDLRIGYSGEGTYNQTGGIVTGGYLRMASGDATGVGVYNLTGGVLKAGADNALFLTGIDAANVKAGGAIIDSNGFAITID